MAKIVEDNLIINISKIVTNDSTETHALTEEQYVTLVSSLTELVWTVLNDRSCVVEIKTE